MGFWQKLFGGAFSAELSGDMEAESRLWMVQCPSCGDEKSIWELGGVRYGASGKKKLYRRCAECGKRGWHTVYKRTPQEQQQNAGGV